MNAQLLQLAHRHGALKARIDAQRETLARQSAPLESALSVADKAVDGVHWMKANPVSVGSAVAVLAILKPSRAWRWGRRAFIAWRGWEKLKKSLAGYR
jgi:YqjK-like protein